MAIIFASLFASVISVILPTYYAYLEYGSAAAWITFSVTSSLLGIFHTLNKIEESIKNKNDL